MAQLDKELLSKLKFKKVKIKAAEDYDLRAGQVLKMKDGEYLLVGHVNKNLGVCDDCTNYEKKDIREIAVLPGF